MKTLIIYFTEDKKSYQIVKPTREFNNDWSGLVQAITKGNYHSYETF